MIEYPVGADAVSGRRVHGGGDLADLVEPLERAIWEIPDAYMSGLVNYRALPEMVRAVPLGEGSVDLEASFEGLKDGGFDGFAAYEMCSPLRGGGSEENPDETARASPAKIRELIG